MWNQGRQTWRSRTRPSPQRHHRVPPHTSQVELSPPLCQPLGRGGPSLGVLGPPRGQQVQGKGQPNEYVLPLFACMGFLSLGGSATLSLPLTHRRCEHQDAGGEDAVQAHRPEGRESSFWIFNQFSLTPPMATIREVACCNSSRPTACGSGQKGATLAWSPFRQGRRRSWCGVGMGSSVVL